MPKRDSQYKKILAVKPQSSLHPSLQSSSGSSAQHGRHSTGTPYVTQSVNELIDHLRRSQVTIDGQQHHHRRTSNMATVHPSLRSILDVPATPPPRPRPGHRSVGPTRTRRVPGPPAPESWLITGSIHAPRTERHKDPAAFSVACRRTSQQTSTLPGGVFPLEGSLQDVILKTMAKNWQKHLEYDGLYLSSAPTRLKEVLLSYIAIIGGKIPVESVRYLFPQVNDLQSAEMTTHHEDDVSEVRRLDLTNALDVDLSMKQITKVLLSTCDSREIQNNVGISMAYGNAPRTQEVSLPESWEEAAELEMGVNPTVEPVTTAIRPALPTLLRFRKLSHLSLAISPTAHAVRIIASWRALLSLAPHLSRLSSLSLAFWPSPTLKPHAATTYATIQNPLSKALPPIPYGGSDMFTAHDGNWAEAAGILRRLSRALYCLRWLNLTGCGQWFDALIWEGTTDLEMHNLKIGTARTAVGPEWNGAWRDIEQIGLGVGWTPVSDDAVTTPDVSGKSPCFAPPLISSRNSDTGTQDWDVHAEREKYYHRKEVERYMKVWNSAHQVAAYLRQSRRTRAGKWIEFDFGADAPTIRVC